MSVEPSEGAVGSIPLRVSPPEVAALGGEVVGLRDASGTLRPGPILDGAAAAVPGGLLSPACHDLAARWDREMTALQHALSFIADALRAAASGYQHADQAGATAFAGSASLDPEPGPTHAPHQEIPIRGGSAW